MASILDILIQILKIDCSVAQCYYPNEIEAMFYLFFFPTVFIILFIYILTNFIFRGGGTVKGIRMLIAIGIYAFIVFEGLYTSVVAISHLWWLLTIILVGLFAFIRHLFTGGGEGGGGHMPGIGGGALGGWVKGRMKDVVTEDRDDLQKEINARFKSMRKIIEEIKKPTEGTDVGSLISEFRTYEGQAETAITELNRRGKIGGINVEKLGKKYWDELSRIQDEFASAKRKSHAG